MKNSLQILKKFKIFKKQLKNFIGKNSLETMPLAEYIFGHVQRFEGTLYIDFYFRKIHRKK